MAHALSPDAQQKIRDLCNIRHKCRTDLLFLMNRILGYKDVTPSVHAPILDILPVFKGGMDSLLSNGALAFTPAVDLWELQGKRKRLILYPRGHLKTSIISIAGTIQWILNYPDIRILITTATGDLAGKILTEISAHFKYNELFRYLFPDYCPSEKKIKDWGNQESFTVPNRKRKAMKEPTCSVSSVGKVIAGSHYELEVCSDMVDKENVKTPGGTQDVISHYKYMDPLLERHEVPEGADLPNHGWLILEGTSYSFADVYSHQLKELGLRISSFGPGVQRAEIGDWLILHGDAEVDSDKHVTIWPARFPWTELKKMEQNMGPALYSAQMRNRPLADDGGLATEDVIQWFNRQTLSHLKAQLRMHTTIDLAGMEADSEGDYTVITTSGFDRDGRCYVVDIRRGRFTPHEVINHIFDVHQVWKPMDFKIEKDAHARVLLPFLQREMAKRQIFPLIIAIKRDTRTSKQHRIRGLQPWFAAKIIRFYNDLTCQTDLLLEITEFPSSEHDDILDTIADQMQNRDGGVSYDVTPDLPKGIPWGQPRPEDKFLEFDPITKEARFLYDQSQMDEHFHAMTGL